MGQRPDDGRLAGVSAALERVGRKFELSELRFLGAGFSVSVVRAGPDLVVRVPSTADAAERGRRMVDVLGALPELPARVPEVVEVLPARESLEHGALVHVWLPGEPVSAGLVRSRGPALARETARFLAALHAVDSPKLEAVLRRAPGEVGPGEGESELWPPDPVVELVAGRLAGPEAAAFGRWRDGYGDWIAGLGRPVVLHGDFWHGNLVARDGRLAAVVDWEDARLGDRAADLCGLWYLGAEFGAAVLRDYTELTGVDSAALGRGVTVHRVRRELRGVEWSVRHDDADELEESLAKVRAALGWRGRV
ncbi:phosphotransferase family protein [Longispora urticae]